MSIDAETQAKIDEYLLSKRDERTSEVYLTNATSTLRAFFSQFDELNVKNVNAFLRGKKASSANAYLTRLQSYAKYAGVELKIEKRKEIKDDEVVALTSQQLEAVIHAAKDDHIRQVIIVLAETGLRIHEFMQVSPKSAKFDPSYNLYTLRVLGKGQKMRTIPMSDRCKKAFDALEFPLKRQDDAICRNITAAGKAAGLEFHITSHTMRHTFASIMLNEKGLRLQELMKIGGWSDANTLLDNYYKAPLGKIAEMMNKSGEVIATSS